MTDTEAELYFKDIYVDVGIYWKKLARELGISQTDINTVETDKHTTNDRCYEMLNKYHQLKGKEFTKIKLVQALYAVGLRSVAENNKLSHFKVQKKLISTTPSNSNTTDSYNRAVLIAGILVFASIVLYKWSLMQQYICTNFFRL